MSVSPAKKPTPKKATKPKVAPTHPTYQQMVKMAVSTLKEPKGSSKAAILKYILAHYKVGDNVNKINARLRSALKRGVTSGLLKQVKGVGASGSFRLGEQAKKKVAVPKPKKTVPKKKTTGSPKPKKASKPKAKTTAKKPAAKKTKSPKKPKSPKKASPKKTAKPKVKKSPKKVVSKK